MKTVHTILLLLAATLVPSPAQDHPSRPRNIILMIGDGMGIAQIQTGMTAKKAPLELEKFPWIGFAKTHSADSYTTDSAAAGTAIATGHKTNNGVVGLDADGKPVDSILALAHRAGLSTGLVVTKDITDATPASFVAHQPSRKLAREIAADIAQSGVDVFIGGGRETFEKGKDGRNLLKELERKNYRVAEGAEAIESGASGRLAGFVSTDWAKKREPDQLMRSSLAAIRILDRNPRGFFLMIEGSRIDSAGHDNDAEGIADEMLDFDKTIGAVLAYAERHEDTLVVVTADHETGGLTLRDGDLKNGTVKARFSTGSHTGVMVPVFAFGPGAENFAGIYENTAFFPRFKKLLQLE